jgi:tetratricopeptide (TPR) repeat protein
MGKFDSAIADCNSVIEKMPKNQFVLVSRAEAYLAKGDLDTALKEFNFVLGLNPNNVRAHTGRGQVFERKHNLEQARADYRSAGFALARDVKEPHIEVRKLFDIVRDDVWNSTKHEQQPFIYGSPPGREDFYFVAGK